MGCWWCVGRPRPASARPRPFGAWAPLAAWWAALPPRRRQLAIALAAALVLLSFVPGHPLDALRARRAAPTSTGSPRISPAARRSCSIATARSSRPWPPSRARSCGWTRCRGPCSRPSSPSRTSGSSSTTASTGGACGARCWANLRSRAYEQGFSTITMQLARNVFAGAHPRPRADAVAEAARGAGGARDRGRVQQAADPRAVPEPRLLRERGHAASRPRRAITSAPPRAPSPFPRARCWPPCSRARRCSTPAATPSAPGSAATSSSP